MADGREIGVVNRHKGETFLVMGNGPSLSTLPDFHEDDFITIGVNRVGLYHYPHYYLWLDRHIIKNERLVVNGTAAMADESFCPEIDGKHEITPDFPVTYFKRYRPPRNTLDPILSEEWPFLFWSRTATFAAINLAVLMGAARIGIVGVDMQDNSHFYDATYKHTAKGYDPRHKFPSQVFILKHYAALAEYAKRREIEIVNLNPDSAVRCFPFVTLKEL